MESILTTIRMFGLLLVIFGHIQSSSLVVDAAFLSASSSFFLRTGAPSFRLHHHSSASSAPSSSSSSSFLVPTTNAIIRTTPTTRVRGLQHHSSRPKNMLLSSYTSVTTTSSTSTASNRRLVIFRTLQASTDTTTETDGSSTTTMASSAVRTTAGALVGDDAGYFALQEQSIVEWIQFTLATGTVLAAVAYIWVLDSGPHGGDQLLQFIQTNILGGNTDPAMTVTVMILIFAFFHSGLAALRTYAEPIVGARPWRVLFAVVSLPLALSCVSYFVNHAREGIIYWDLSQFTVLHDMAWIINLISFLFLYPSTFNLLEIAAIQKPQLHLWETGIIRITRHPQAIGMILWSVAHGIWLGTSTALAACTALTVYHLWAIYHGDRRLQTRHGENFDYIKSKTSVIPFQAIVEGRQVLPPDYYRELVRLPYIVVIVGTIGAYYAHPWMQAGAALLHW